MVEVAQNRCGRGGDFGLEGKWVGLLDDRSSRAHDSILVSRTVLKAGDEAFPHATGANGGHGLARVGPVVEVANNADLDRVGGPHREACAADSVAVDESPTEVLPKAGVITSIEKVLVNAVEALGGTARFYVVVGHDLSLADL